MAMPRFVIFLLAVTLLFRAGLVEVDTRAAAIAPGAAESRPAIRTANHRLGTDRTLPLNHSPATPLSRGADDSRGF